MENLILEGFRTNRFYLSDEDFKYYAGMVSHILYNLLYSKTIAKFAEFEKPKEQDFSNVMGQIPPSRWEQKLGRKKSILNFANTNKALINRLLETFGEEYRLNSPDKFFDFVYFNRRKLFVPGEEWYNLVVNTLAETVEKGRANELIVFNYLQKHPEIKKVENTPESSKADMLYGIDLIFWSEKKGKLTDYTCQVKPFSWILEEGSIYKVKSTSRTKLYETDYLIFVKTEVGGDQVLRTKLLMVRNRSVELVNEVYSFPKEDLIIEDTIQM